MHFFEDIESGSGASGSFTFTTELDQEICRAIRSAALSSRRGEGRKIAVRRAPPRGVGLARRVGVHEASGDRWPASGQRGSARGEKVAAWGPSPGFRELRWIKPVLAGDTISFASEVESCGHRRKRPSGASCRPQHRHQQRGELVFSLLATAFVPRRNAGA